MPTALSHSFGSFTDNRPRISGTTSWATHKSAQSVGGCKRKIWEGESLFAFLDDVYANCAPERVLAVH